MLNKEPIDLPENGYIAFTEETAPNFLGGEVTLAQYRRGDYEQPWEQEGEMQL